MVARGNGWQRAPALRLQQFVGTQFARPQDAVADEHVRALVMGLREGPPETRFFDAQLGADVPCADLGLPACGAPGCWSSR